MLAEPYYLQYLKGSLCGCIKRVCIPTFAAIVDFIIPLIVESLTRKLVYAGEFPDPADSNRMDAAIQGSILFLLWLVTGFIELFGTK
jgi:hypothetical protein